MGDDVELESGPKPPERRIPVNTAEPPPEVRAIIEEQGLEPDKIEGWLAVPAIRPPLERLSRKELAKGQVDAVELLEPLLGDPRLKGTLRTMDVLNGCTHQCDTCVLGAVLPSKMFSQASLEKLFEDERFIEMLQPDSLRFGSSGDILNHPEGVEIARMVLDKTRVLDEQRMDREGKHHQIKILTNYRPGKENERRLDELIGLAEQYPERFELVVSLPFNREDTINKAFVKYAQKRTQVFGEHDVDEDGNFLKTPREYGDEIQDGWANVGINDVRHTQYLFVEGRGLSEKANAGRVPAWFHLTYETDHKEGIFERRGRAKTYLNPDALWLTVYATPYESNTARVSTPLNPDNIGALSHVPFHYDFPTPPNWPGGKGRRRDIEEVDRLIVEAEHSGKTFREPETVG